MNLDLSNLYIVVKSSCTGHRWRNAKRFLCFLLREKSAWSCSWFLFFCFRDRSFITSQWGAAGYNFLRGLIFGGSILKMNTKCEGLEILRHRNGLPCKRCQTILWLKQIHISFESRQKIRFVGSLSETKCYPYTELGPRTYQLFLPPGM